MSFPGTKPLREWAEGKPRFVVMLAMSVLPTAGFLPEMLRLLSQRHKVAKILPTPNQEQWTLYYRDHRAWSKTLCRDTGFTIDDELDLIDFLDLMREISREARNNPEQFKSDLKAELQAMPRSELEQLWFSTHEMWDSAITGSMEYAQMKDLTDEENEEVEHWSKCQSVLFMLLVWLPCWVLYQKQPGELYARARRGDTESLAILLGVDKTRLSDPSLMRRVVESSYSAKPIDYKRVTSAISDQSVKIPNPKQMKIRLASFVSQMSKKIGHPTSALEIQRLYDAIAQAQSGKAVDTDFRTLSLRPFVGSQIGL